MKRLLLFTFLLVLIASVEAQVQRPAPEKIHPGFLKIEDGYSRTQAQSLFQQSFQLTSADEMRLLKTETDNIGFTHDKFQQVYKGIIVDGATYTLHSKDGLVKTMSGNFRDIKNAEVTPSLSPSVSLNFALAHIHARVYAWEDAVKDGYPGYNKPTGQLVIFADPEFRGSPRLAYKFDIYAAEPLYRAWVYVDAITGKVLKENSRIHETNTAGSASTLYNGNRSITADYTGSSYRLQQTASGGGVQTFSLNNGTNYGSATDITSSSSSFTSDPAANQAHWGAERTYDYYLTKHGRNSYNNTGGVLKSYVHYSNNYVNAYWDGTRMTYGDGDGSSYGPLVSLDICGHELTHGVTEYSANLTYSYQSGALNESFSDIFGESIENYSLGNNDWLMGDDIGIGGSGALRSMKNPNQFGDPDTYLGTYWYTGSGDYGGVHTNSGVQNKWFYILSAGESGTNDIGKSYNVTGIGITKAAAIAYRNLTVYLSSSSNYTDARTGAIQAAIDLYGAGSAEEIATTNAWYAVGVGSIYCAGCINYCTSAGNNSSYEWIKTVTVGSFTNSSGAAGYTDFTGQTINLVAGSNNNISLVPGFSSTTYNEYWKIWVDFNKDGDFTDAGEQLFASGASKTTVTGSIVIPASASGTTRMRVTMKYNSTPSSSCETFSYGEVEDYTVSFGTAAPDNQPPSAPVLSSTGKTATTINLSWTASSDNVGVTGYEVYVNSALKTTTTSLSYTVTGLSASTTYSIYVKAKDAAGNATNSNTISATTQGSGGGPTTILAHYFETGWDGWLDGGGDCGRYSGSRSYEGNYSIYIRDNSGTQSAMTSKSYNVSSFNQLVIDFYFYAYSMENGEDFQVKYYNGSSWNTVATYVSGSSFSGDGFYHATVTLNSGTFPTNAQFRFQCDASSNSDIIYIDQVSVTGTNTFAVGRSQQNTQSCEPVSSNIRGIVPQELGNRLVIYPNPAINSLSFQADQTIQSVRIYSLNGALLKLFVNVKNGTPLNISMLRSGLYIARFETPDGIITKKFIKK